MRTDVRGGLEAGRRELAASWDGSRSRQGKYDLIVMNYANHDMIGHTGKFDATAEELTSLDEQIRRIVDATLAAGGAVLLTYDQRERGGRSKPRDARDHDGSRE